MIERSRLGASVGNETGMAAVVLGLCPAAAVSARVIDALWMSAGVIVVVVLASLCVGLVARLRRGTQPAPQTETSSRRWFGALVFSSLIAASFEIALVAAAPEESAALGIYVAIIGVNCLVLGHLESAGRSASLGKDVGAAARDGCAFAGCLIVVTLAREVLGSGTITLFPMGDFGGTVAVRGLAADPARALGMAGGGLICLGYLAAALRMAGAGRSRDQSAARPVAAKDGEA